MQHERVVAYALRRFRSHKLNYLTYDSKLATIIFTLKIWRHYLCGGEISDLYIPSNFKVLILLKGIKHETACWMELLKDYDREIMY